MNEYERQTSGARRGRRGGGSGFGGEGGGFRGEGGGFRGAGGGFRGAGGRGGRRAREGAPAAAPPSGAAQGADTIDALFAPHAPAGARYPDDLLWMIDRS